jgi:hypothetical protein
MKKITYLMLFIVVFFNQLTTAQSINNWSVKKESEVSKTRLKLDRKTIPSKYKVLSLDFNSLQINLKSASKRPQNNKLASTLLLDFPHEDGTMESFSIEKTSVLAPELEAKYPEIQSYYGVSNKNPLNKIYISTSPGGFTGLITGDKTIYIDPVSKNDASNYIVYDRKDCTRNPDDTFVCNAVMDETLNNAKTASNAKTSSTTDGNLRTYRLALACTSAYSAYYGNTIAQVLAAMNTTITRVNSIYRRDLSVIFQIVASNDRLIYINGFNKDGTPDPDPYDNYNGNTMLSTNTSNITGLIGVGAYDIGHVFSTGGGGIAGTGPCTASTKGQGVTGIVTPQFDPFDIDYVCHEIGHQFGAAHTYYNACFGQKELVADYEPGSASTIMGYAGICAPNIQGNSDAYFHAKSIEQMTTAIGGHTCVSGTLTGNAAPVITAPVTATTSYTIPKSTPFTLTGIATDADGDPMTYTWEQFDNNDGGVQPPTATNTAGPVFRSFLPTSSPSRTFPNLAAIISNTTPTWEVLPSVERVMNFRLTARDNSTLGGRTSSADCTVSIIGTTAGPFLVSSPNTGSEIWYVGETKAVTWDVAGTGVAPYSTTVNIKLSTDGGYTYPITLASGVANSGTANITVPNNIGKLNRIKIEAAANIFFDISNANFEIKSGKFEMTSAASTQSVCKPTDAVYTINYTPAPAFSETTIFSAVGAPAGSTITFTPTTISASGTFTMTVSNTSGVAAGNYPITLKGTSATANINFPVLLNVFDNTIGNVTLASPSNGATNQQTSSLLQWNALTSASSYLVQISTSPTFATITESATVTGTSYQTTLLTQGTINYWRVKPINSCTSGSFSEVYVFQIANDLCKTYTNVTFEPNAVWETNSINAVSAKINVPDNIIISKVSFYMKATHPKLSDIKMQFSGPTGIFAEIYNRDCGGKNFDVTFDDAGSVLTCGTGLSGTQQASQSLSKFNGSSSLGTWTLLATDRVSNTSGGTFTNFTITICGKLQIVNNITVANNSLSLKQGATATIAQAKLEATQPTATTAQLIYTITQLPTNGTLKLNNVAMVVGGTFTQADINTNSLSYTNNGINANPDSFKFSINGINLALLGGQTYNITVCGNPVANVTSLPTVNAQCSATLVAPTATSNCYGTITGTTPTLFPIIAQGTTVVTWTYNDGNGNTATQTQNVILNNTMTAVISGTAAICSGSSTNLQVAITGGVSPYTVIYTNGSSNFTVTNYTSGANIAVSPTITTTYTLVSVTSAEGCLSPTNSGSAIKTIATTTWNGSAWSNGTPTSTTAAVISGNYSAAANITACTLTVNNNAVVIIPSGYNVNLNGAITVSSGSFTLNNNANLIQSSNVANSGNITVKRNSSALLRLDYTLWSSPVTNTGLFLQAFSPATSTNRFYYYNVSTNLYTAIANPATTNFANGQGYLIRMPNDASATVRTNYPGVFTGVPNNGNIPITMTNGGVGKRFNLIGNPYPSPISMTQFVADNNTNITGTLYFWRKTNNVGSPTYCTWTAGTFITNGESQVVNPNGIIQIGQGFFVEALNSATSVSFNNTQRAANNANQFFKTKVIERNTIWLNATNTTGNFSQMAVGYITDATLGVDEFDGKYYNDGAISLNSILDNSDYVIQGRPLPFDGTDIVPLSFKATNAGDYTIAIDHVDGLFSSAQDIILKDNETGTETDLKTNGYTFSATAGATDTRFLLKYQKTLGISTPTFDEKNVIAYKNNGKIYIKSNGIAIDNVKLFDIRGRLLFEKTKVNANETSIESSKYANQVLILQIRSEDKKLVNKKIVN